MVIEDHIKREDSLTEEGTLMEDPLMEVEDTLTEEDTQVVDPWYRRIPWQRTPDGEGPPGPPGGQGQPSPQRPPGPMRPIIVQTFQVTLDATALENTFDTGGQSIMQLARAQDQTNRQLQQHIQNGQANMQAHTRALQQLATSTYQRNFNHIFTSIPICDGSYREGFFPGLNV